MVDAEHDTFSILQRYAALPLRPIWRGFAIDSVVYASAWALAVLSTVGIRRVARYVVD